MWPSIKVATGKYFPIFMKLYRNSFNIMEYIRKKVGGIWALYSYAYIMSLVKQSNSISFYFSRNIFSICLLQICQNILLITTENLRALLFLLICPNFSLLFRGKSTRNYTNFLVNSDFEQTMYYSYAFVYF